MTDMKKHLINQRDPIAKGLIMLNDLGADLTLFVVDDNNVLLGTLTDGDVRRGLIKNLSTSDAVEKFMNTKFRFLQRNNYTLQQVEEYKASSVRMLPIVDSEKKIYKIVNFAVQQTILPIDVLIMAGGEGQRLRPLTENTPKPLLKVGSKPIIEYSIDRLAQFGVDKINISINYLGEQLINYFKNGEDKNLNISYVKETEKLGTAGALSLIDNFVHDTVLLMNSDLLTNIDFEDLYNNFKNSDADLIVASIPYKVKIPYAIFEIENENVLSLQEKPTYTYYSNAGIYLLKKEHISCIPKNKHFNATDLIETLIAKEKKVCYYPILGYWLDIGNIEDFKRAQEDIKHIKV